MLTLMDLLAMVHGLTAERVKVWISRGFIVPERVAGEPQFADIDVARVRLICELEDELSLDEDAVAVLLSMLDQIYSLRSRLRFMSEAIAGQPPEVRDAILALLARHAEPRGDKP